MGWCISEALAFPHNTDPVIKKWLQTSNVNNYLVSIVDKQITNSCTSELTVLLKLALTENGDGGIYQSIIIFTSKVFIIFSFQVKNVRKCSVYYD